MNIREELNKEIEDKEKELRAWKLCANLLPNELPHAQQAYSHQNYIAISIPASPKMLKDVRRVLGRDWHRKYRMQHQDGDVELRYVHKEYPQAELLIWLILNYEGATCQRVPIEEKTETIYKMVCS